jgi:hypothetical protein
LRSSVVASIAGVALAFLLAIAALVVVHLAFGDGGLMSAVAAAFEFCLESPLVELILLI